ncbi:hypothetical protein GCK72_004404 [Caenorhabditis remanei]|uniref:Uncharacterized protein n=1 Tax=Caenorhabditis remanei TaxID=31234 RepID=A0A6A5HC96_CAERE|nr:hypothetical protein GCK72_004404 [Caenorhabditis remanei]KAF1764456.1 hypothetical protein GCK72_004404 [Caenorhabditis remanei]
MIFLVNNQTYFFAVFLMNYKRDFGALSIFMLILEIFGFLWGAIVTIRGCLWNFDAMDGEYGGEVDDYAVSEGMDTVARECDYEKKPRQWIPIFVLLALQTTSWLIAFSAINILLNIYIWLVIGVLVLITNFVLFGYIWYWNIRVHRILDNSIFIPSKYSLQARFQAKENARSLEFLKVTVFTVSLVLLLQCLFFILQSSNVFQDYEVILYYLVDFCNAGHPVVLIPLAMISVPVWKKKFFGHLHCVKKVCSRKTLPMVDVLKGSTSLKMETDQYFSQFNKAWN